MGCYRHDAGRSRRIAAELGVSPATVSRVLKRLGLHRIEALEPAERVRRYHRERPGELIHIEIKKLGRFDKLGHRITGDRQAGRSRGVGWEFVHVSIDDSSRIGFSQILPDEKQQSAVAFLKPAVAHYPSLGITVARVMTNNGSCEATERRANVVATGEGASASVYPQSYCVMLSVCFRTHGFIGVESRLVASN